MPGRFEMTRKQRAAQLIKRLEEGPALRGDLQFSQSGLKLSKASQQAIEQLMEESCKLWLKTWITPSVVELVPELRKKPK